MACTDVSFGLADQTQSCEGYTHGKLLLMQERCARCTAAATSRTAWLTWTRSGAHAIGVRSPLKPLLSIPKPQLAIFFADILCGRLHGWHCQ